MLHYTCITWNIQKETLFCFWWMACGFFFKKIHVYSKWRLLLSLRPLVMCAKWSFCLEILETKFVWGETLSKPSNIALLFSSCFNHSILVDRSSRLCKHWVGLIRRPLMTELLVPRSSCICSVLYWACKNKHCRPVSAKLHVQTFAKISVDLNGFPNSLGCF